MHRKATSEHRAARPRSRTAEWAAGLVYGAAIAAIAFGHLLFPVDAARAQDEGEAVALLSEAELEELVGPVALYPDELLALVLPASTYPLQIVQGARFLERHAKDPELKPDEGWDESVLGLLNYPEVVDLMNEDLDWTWQLGEAVVNQQDDVMDAVQRFRARVDAAGNLEADEIEVVRETEEGEKIIVIQSSNPEVIYVPTYQPSTVVVQQPAPVVVYSPRPVYWRPGAVFWTGLFVGTAVGFGLRWGRWGRRYGSINVNRNVNVNVNRPGGGSRPGTRPGGPGGGNAWKPDRRPGSGARPGGGTARPGGGAGVRPGGGNVARPGGGTGARPGGGAGASRPGAGAGSRPTAGTGQRQAASRGAASGRELTSSSRGGSSSRSSSVGSLGRGSQTRSQASRGASSRGTTSRSGSRGGSRGGGGRGAGGRGGGRR